MQMQSIFAFPTIFCGQRRPSKEERTVPVHYSDIVKWELRSVDRRAAQSVPNILVFLDLKEGVKALAKNSWEDHFEIY